MLLSVFVLLAMFGVFASEASARTEDIAVPTNGVYGKARIGVDAGVKTDAPVYVPGTDKQNFLKSRILPFFTGERSGVPSMPKNYNQSPTDRKNVPIYRNDGSYEARTRMVGALKTDETRETWVSKIVLK